MKVAMIGTCPSSRYLAPFKDPAWEMWACGIEDSKLGIITTLPRIDKFFCFNTNMLWPEHREAGVPFLNWLKAQPFEVWMQDQRFFPQAKSYPIDEMLGLFGHDFFASSMSYMMAKAIADMKAEPTAKHEIALFGVDLSNDKERIKQRQALKHFIWLASSTGIRVTAPLESDILQPMPLYGFGESTARGRKFAARRHEIEEHVASLEAEIRSKQDNLLHLQGALDDHEYHENIWNSKEHT